MNIGLHVILSMSKSDKTREMHRGRRDCQYMSAAKLQSNITLC